VSGDHRTVSIEVNDTDVDRLQAFVDKNGLDVRSIEFSTATGGGGWNNRHVLSLAEIKGTVEKVYGVQVSGFTKLRAVVSEAQLDKIQQDPMVKGIK
jgi:molybdenum cofactor biosynthesis enzyme MoaA